MKPTTEEIHHKLNYFFQKLDADEKLTQKEVGFCNALLWVTEGKSTKISNETILTRTNMTDTFSAFKKQPITLLEVIIVTTLVAVIAYSVFELIKLY